MYIVGEGRGEKGRGQARTGPCASVPLAQGPPLPWGPLDQKYFKIMDKFAISKDWGPLRQSIDTGAPNPSPGLTRFKADHELLSDL